MILESLLMSLSAKTIAYLRVSTIDQNLDKNRADILRLANEKGVGQVQFIEEQASGKISWHHRKIASILESLASRVELHKRVKSFVVAI